MNEDTLLQKIKRKIDQLYKSGFSNPTEIAKKIHSDLSIDENTRTINHTRGNVKYYISRAKKRSENPALAQACEERGINFDNVGIAWNKDKKWSIQFRPSKTGPTFEEMLQDHIDEVFYLNNY